jgi:hypothetical protein
MWFFKFKHGENSPQEIIAKDGIPLEFFAHPVVDG